MTINRNPETPPDERRLKIKTPKSKAAGIPAVASSFNHSLKKMGLTRTIKTLRLVNQVEGFDCPGCAWPDPKHRSSFEYCENGAKAVADEATTARVNPEFFASHSIQEMLGWSDYKLNSSGRITHPMVLHPGSDYYEPITWNDAYDLITSKLCCLLYTSPSPRDQRGSRMPSSA